MTHIAIYGKGGIGKSTVSSNISFSLSEKGVRVTQIGCDPKHDSTISLIHGQEQPTVLDYVSRVKPSERRLGDIMVTGANGINCIEAGGPKPGIGCAGRGILTMFDALDAMGLGEVPNDITVYDVLGDVVCGGFAVPMRKENTDAVFVVTSGEFMAMYAANNILRGMMNFDPATPRVAGIILNRRGMDGEYERVKKLADAVGVPIVADIPRAPEFKEASLRHLCVSEACPGSVPAEIFSQLAEVIMEISRGERQLYCPKPMSDMQIDDFGKGIPVLLGNYAPKKPCCGETDLSHGMCATFGSAHEAGRIIDLPVIIHGPMSCGHIMNQTVERNYLSIITENPEAQRRRGQRFICTDMKDSSSIFGGHQKLKDALLQAKSEGYDTAMVITTCVTGMIGDDVDHVMKDFMDENPGFQVLMVYADGNHTGTSEDGRAQVLERFFSLIDTEVEPTELTLNLIDSSFGGFDSGKNQRWFTDLLDRMGIKLGVKIFDDCTLEQVRGCKKNKLNAMIGDSNLNNSFRRRMESMGFSILPKQLPRGHTETVEWIRSVARELGDEHRFDDLIEEVDANYRSAVERLKPVFKDKVIDVVLHCGSNADWMIESLLDVGADVRNVYALHSRFSPFFHTRFSDRLNIHQDIAYRPVIEMLDADKPDLILNNAMFWHDLEIKTTGSGNEFLTERASVAFLEKISRTLITNDLPAWKKWRELI